jgi:stalled ribosome alternative rescue factor ArfA
MTNSSHGNIDLTNISQAISQNRDNDDIAKNKTCWTQQQQKRKGKGSGKRRKKKTKNLHEEEEEVAIVGGGGGRFTDGPTGCAIRGYKEEELLLDCRRLYLAAS